MERGAGLPRLASCRRTMAATARSDRKYRKCRRNRKRGCSRWRALRTSAGGQAGLGSQPLSTLHHTARPRPAPPRGVVMESEPHPTPPHRGPGRGAPPFWESPLALALVAGRLGRVGQGRQGRQGHPRARDWLCPAAFTCLPAAAWRPDPGPTTLELLEPCWSSPARLAASWPRGSPAGQRPAAHGSARQRRPT